MAEKKIIYADHAATTRISQSVLEAMLPYFQDGYGNASGVYGLARSARKAIEEARRQTADALGALPDSIYFTSGGTEADNWAVREAAYAGRTSGKTHLITSNIEHHAVLHTCRRLEEEGFTITRIPANAEGMVSPEQVREALRPETALVSIMYANNEIGTIQPVDAIGSLCRQHGVLFHTDAVQAVGHLPIHLERQPVDLLSLSGHKLGAPKGIGALYIRKGVTLPNLMEGGGQEHGRRPGTENTALIVGLGIAMQEAASRMEEDSRYIARLRDLLEQRLLTIPATRLNGDRLQRLPGISSVSFDGIEGETMLLLLDMQGICASAGSACATGSPQPSHVLRAIGLSDRQAKGTIRFSLGSENTEQEISYIAKTVEEIAERLRAMTLG
ncbi:MAG TPA: aminotransferase class V-fold PLP-dependent enzyme [Firmicutes bacterium]|nr:aminotransferase class V-fold PLP-dependent enzyme [Bacillota bacterium]